MALLASRGGHGLDYNVATPIGARHSTMTFHSLDHTQDADTAFQRIAGNNLCCYSTAASHPPSSVSIFRTKLSNTTGGGRGAIANASGGQDLAGWDRRKAGSPLRSHTTGEFTYPAYPDGRLV